MLSISETNKDSHAAWMHMLILTCIGHVGCPCPIKCISERPKGTILSVIDAGMCIWNENNFSCHQLHWDLKARKWRLIKDNAENLLMLRLHTREIRICTVARKNPNQSYSKDRAKVHLEKTHFLIKTWISTIARVQANSIVCGKSKAELLQGELKLVLLLVFSENPKFWWC